MAADLGSIVGDVRNRLYKLEQRMTSPEYAQIPSDLVVDTVTVGGTGGTTVGYESAPPSNLQATPGAFEDNVYVDVEWDAPSAGAYTYQLEIYLKTSDTPATYELQDVKSTSTTNIRINGLRANATYGLRLYALNSIALISPPIPLDGPLDVTMVADATVPAAPTGLAIYSGLTSLLAKWDSNTESDVALGQGSYVLQMDTVNTFDSPNLQEIRTTANVGNFVGLDGGTVVFVQVSAMDVAGNQSPWSPWLSTTIGEITAVSSTDGAAPATSPAPTVVGGFQSLFIKWTAVANADPVIYDVHLSTVNGFAPSGATKAAEVSGTLANIKTLPGVATPLTPGTTYYIKIVARDADGSAGASAQGSGTPALINGGADIVANTITAASILAGAITTTELAANSITSSKIAADAITAGKILAGTITTTEIAAGTIVAGDIAAGTITGDKIAVNTISAGSIKTSTLDTADITLDGGSFKIGTPGTLPGNNGILINVSGITLYQNGAVKALLPVAGSATFKGDITGASGIFSGTIEGGTIIASAIPTAVLNFNVIRNYNFEQLNTAGYLVGWNYTTAGVAGTVVGDGPWVTTGTAWSVSAEDINAAPTPGVPLGGTRSLRVQSTANTGGVAVRSDPVTVAPGERFAVDVLLSQVKAASGGQYRPLYVTVFFTDKNGTAIGGVPTIVNASSVTPGGVTTGDLVALGLTSTAAGRADVLNSFTPASAGSFRVVSTVVVPAGAVFMRLALTQWAAGTANATTTYTLFDHVVMHRAIDARDHQGGTITGSLITGGTLRTAGSGPRVVVDTNDAGRFVKFYDGAGKVGSVGTVDISTIPFFPGSTDPTILSAPTSGAVPNTSTYVGLVANVVTNYASSAMFLTLDDRSGGSVFIAGGTKNILSSSGNLDIADGNIVVKGSTTSVQFSTLGQANGSLPGFLASTTDTHIWVASGGQLYVRLIGGGANYRPVTASAFNPASSRELKTDIVYTDETMQDEVSTKLLAMKPSRFVLKQDGKPTYGFIAEDMLAIDPLLATKDDSGLLGYSLAPVVAMTVHHLQALTKQVEDLRTQIAALPGKKA